MAIDQAALIQMVYDSVFTQLIKPPIKPPVKSREVLLNLEFPGQQLEASQYQNPWTPQNINGSQFATEMLSSLIDAIPLVDAIYVDSGVTVEEMYEFMLGAAALPLPAGPDGQIPMNPVNNLLSNARQVFEQTRLASALQPTLAYHPSYAMPGNWADPIAAQGWTSISINSNQSKPKPDSPFLRAGGLKHLREGIWKVPPKLLKPDLTTVHPVRPDLETVRPITFDGALIDRIRPMSARSLNASATMISPDLKALTPGQAVELQRVTPNPLLMDRINPDLLATIQPELLVSQPVDQSTSDIQISFRCCRVNFNRPWLLKSLLEVTGWTLPGQAAGSLSNGTFVDNGGTFPLLPIGFVVIRDLQIRANWGEVDRDIAAQAGKSDNAIGFGPFALSGRYAESGKGYQSSFDGVTISSPGLQVLGWINLLTPYTPPV
jgi:hypothetical protein